MKISWTLSRKSVFLQLSLASFFLLLFLTSGCVRMINSKPPGPWHEAYQPLIDIESEIFVSNALARAIADFGVPVIPVNTVMLRRSRKTELARRYRVREDFSLTECVDPTNGFFVIYIGVDPDHENYFALLGHECAHLINPFITDWYMEGMATVFSEQVCVAEGKEWGGWKRHFMKSRRAPYALSYRMMLDMQAAFPQEYLTLQQFAVPSGVGVWHRIDIEGWIETLPAGRRAEALAIIEPNIKGLKRQTNAQYSFTIPEKLK
ncbi:MAG: hypothetical protein OES84_03645 [Kiritimatiellaceae bacterium]|nr:hypothetical protein [Kiritimatiellaceae bacterium]